MPRIYQINSKQNLIVFDEPSPSDLAQTAALTHSPLQENDPTEVVSPPKALQGIIAAPASPQGETAKTQQPTEE